jgi:ribulose bisphosphate carboxylase small subunit
LPVGAADVGAGAKAAGLGVLGRGVADLGNVLTQIKKEQIAASDAISETKADALIGASKLGFEQFKKDNELIMGTGQSPSNWQSEDIARIAKLREDILNNPDLPLSQRARARMEATLDAHGTLSESLTRYHQTITLNRNERAALSVGLEQAYASNDALMIERMELRWERESSRLFGSNTAARDKAYQDAVTRGQAAGASAAIENIKPFLIDAIGVNNKPEDGYRVLNAATEQLVENGILTKPEAAEANKKLGDWIDNYVSGRIKAAKEADKLTTIQTYQELSKPILDGKLTYEDIDNSNLRETRRSGEQTSDADKWRKYIKGSYKDAPTKNTPVGHENSFAAVYDVATLQLSPKEGYDVLLEARFIDKSITNDQFEWAIDKIENPYSRHVLEDLNATMKSNLEDYNRLFASDDERNKKVNEALISWVDEQETPPSKKEMFAMSSAFRAGGGQPYDIGAIIERGGVEWEIVGFDNDGEPLVEEIP